LNWRNLGFVNVAGTDEVGRGCLAGPVYAAAVILRPETRIKGLTDSKLVPSERRIEIAEQIKWKALCWAVAFATVEEIETINILRASLLAMRRAVEALTVPPELVLVDGIHKFDGPWNQKTIIGGDLICKPISAASIIAKVSRDRLMAELDEKFPGYAFREHKGYGTSKHHKAIAKLGPSLIHRKTFAGIKEYYPEGPAGGITDRPIFTEQEL
jgi:ribonuclease HII